ncbi:hypothetical protein LT959_002889 [Escherichia coli]|nr:hypothetical protein [Escherichia coli]
MLIDTHGLFAGTHGGKLRFRPDAASVDDSREKFTPAQNMIFSRKSAQLASHQSV